MQIIGAGMAGLLAAQMMRRQHPVIRESQPSLPNNHNALLRFRTDAVSRATGIAFKRVWVTKGFVDAEEFGEAVVYSPQELTIQDLNRYAFKVTGELLPRSIMDLNPGERYVAPRDFISRLAEGLNIQFNSPLTDQEVWAQLNGPAETKDPVVSTIPMPAMMKMAMWQSVDTPEFKWRPVFTTRGLIVRPKTELYQTLYYPGSQNPWYRISITGSEVIAESMIQTDGELVEMLESRVIRDFGLPALTTINFSREVRQEYGKLAPTNEQKRRAFILAMTDRYRIYSLGRFATWRQILLDDVVHDVEVIQKFVTERDQYARRLIHG